VCREGGEGGLGDVTEAGRPVLRGLEVILQILRFGGIFCGDHGASAPPSLVQDHIFTGRRTIAVFYRAIFHRLTVLRKLNEIQDTKPPHTIHLYSESALHI